MSANSPASDHWTYELRKPVEHAGQTYTELKLREPTAGDLKAVAAEGEGVGLMLALMFRITAVPPPALEQLSARDFMRAQRYLEGFLIGDQ